MQINTYIKKPDFAFQKKLVELFEKDFNATDSEKPTCQFQGFPFKIQIQMSVRTVGI